MSKSITQDMAYRQSLMKCAEKYGVSKASRKYNKSGSYIYFWRSRSDGSAAFLACQSKRPHSHPNQHTEDELKLIRDMRRRNPRLGLIEFWWRLKQRGYSRHPESLYRVMQKLELFSAGKEKKKYQPKPYQQMTYPGQRVQVDVKVVPRKCIANTQLRLFQYTAIDELPRLRFLAAYPEQSTYSSANFLKRLVNGMSAGVLRWSVSRPTMALSSLIAFPTANGTFSHCSRPPLLSWASGISSSNHILQGTTARWSAATKTTRSAFSTT